MKKTVDVFKFQALGWASLCIGLIAVAPAFGAAKVEGTADIGGGSGVVCRDAAGAVKSAQLLDLYEGIHSYKFQIPEVDLEPKSQAAAALLRLSYGFTEDSEESPSVSLRNLLNRINLAAEGVYIESPADQGEERAILLPRGCRREGIGQREKKDGRVVLTIVPDVYAALSKTHQAAFLVHEAIYSYYQTHFKKNVAKQRGTIEIRKITAALFAANTNLEMISIAGNFLFSGIVYLDAFQAGTRATLIGRSNPLDMHLDQLTPPSADKFFCEGDGARAVSHAIIDPASPRTWMLQMKETKACSSRLVIKDLRGLLMINERDVLEVTGTIETALVFLKDHPRYREYSLRARAPHVANPAGR